MIKKIYMEKWNEFDTYVFQEPKPPIDLFELSQLEEHKDFNFRLMIFEAP
jgi:hypothetical protein